MKKSDNVFLEDILDSIKKIEKYVKGLDVSGFEKDQKTKDAVFRNFEIIGEAATRLSKKFKESHLELELHRAIGLRNQLIHGYDKIKPAIIWRTIKNDLPKLKKQIEGILKK